MQVRMVITTCIVASSPGHSQILSHSHEEKLGYKVKSGSGLGINYMYSWCQSLLYVSTIVENLHSTSFFQLRLAGDFNCMEWVVSGCTIMLYYKAVVTLAVHVCHQSSPLVER